MIASAATIVGVFSYFMVLQADFRLGRVLATCLARRQQRRKIRPGRIDWYRYQTYVLLPRLIPFIRDVIEKYGECFLVQDGAPAHNAWQQTELLEIQGLTVLPWPGNSPDLNQIEPC